MRYETKAFFVLSMREKAMMSEVKRYGYTKSDTLRNEERENVLLLKKSLVWVEGLP